MRSINPESREDIRKTYLVMWRYERTPPPLPSGPALGDIREEEKYLFVVYITSMLCSLSLSLPAAVKLKKYEGGRTEHTTCCSHHHPSRNVRCCRCSGGEHKTPKYPNTRKNYAYYACLLSLSIPPYSFFVKKTKEKKEPAEIGTMARRHPSLGVNKLLVIFPKWCERRIEQLRLDGNEETYCITRLQHQKWSYIPRDW